VTYEERKRILLDLMKELFVRGSGFRESRAQRSVKQLELAVYVALSFGNRGGSR